MSTGYLVALATILAAMLSARFFLTALPLPGADALVEEIDALGTSTVIFYVVPAALLVIGLRRQSRIAVAAVVLALTAVGVTMYDGGPLETHLTAIFVSIVILIGVASALVLPPWRDCSDARG